MEAIHRVEEEVRTNLSVLFIGEGSDEKELRNLVDKKGLHRNTVLLGPLVGKKKIMWIKAMDIMVLPTKLPETFPTIILEAWSHGVIPVIYSFPGADEIIKENRGYIVKNVDELARMIEKLVRNPELLETMRTRIIKHLKHSNYCVENAIKEIESLYIDCG